MEADRIVEYIIKTDSKHPFLRSLIENDELELLSMFMGKEFDLNYPWNGMTLLHFACIKSKYEIVKLLLDNGADPNVRNIKGETALHSAAKSGNLDVVKLILETGINKELRDCGYRFYDCPENLNTGYTASEKAVQFNHPELAQYIDNFTKS